MIHTRLLHSLHLITPENGSDAAELKEYAICQNEPFSFQLAYKRFDDPDAEKNPEEQHFFVRLTTELPVNMYHVACVPVLHSFSRIEPKQPTGLYPDILIPKQTNAAPADHPQRCWLPLYRGR